MEEISLSQTCPQCSQPLPPGVDTCPHCGRDGANPFIAPAPEPKPAVGSKLPLALAAVVFGCVAIGFAAPGLGVLLAMVFVPAVVRAAAVVKRRREAAGAHDSRGDIASAVLASAGITFAVWLASAVAFATVCFPLGLLSFDIRTGGGVGMVFAFGLGGLAGLAVFFWFMRKLWPQAAKDD